MKSTVASLNLMGTPSPASLFIISKSICQNSRKQETDCAFGEEHKKAWEREVMILCLRGYRFSKSPSHNLSYFMVEGIIRKELAEQ